MPIRLLSTAEAFHVGSVEGPVFDLEEESGNSEVRKLGRSGVWKIIESV
jgi:hypothetical protein